MGPKDPSVKNYRPATIAISGSRGPVSGVVSWLIPVLCVPRCQLEPGIGRTCARNLENLRLKPSRMLKASGMVVVVAESVPRLGEQRDGSSRAMHPGNQRTPESLTPRPGTDAATGRPNPIPPRSPSSRRSRTPRARRSRCRSRRLRESGHRG